MHNFVYYLGHSHTIPQISTNHLSVTLKAHQVGVCVKAGDKDAVVQFSAGMERGPVVSYYKLEYMSRWQIKLNKLTKI